MLTVVPAEGALLERVLDATYVTSHQGLSRQAFARFDAALRKTAWGLPHQRRVALADGDDVLATAQLSDLTGTLDGQRVRICGIDATCADPVRHERCHAQLLVERLIDTAKRDGTDLALLCTTADRTCPIPESFERFPTMDVELTVAESPRYGAPMTMVRCGEDRDLAPIAAMGETRADPFRFHLDRDVDRVKYAITRARLLSGLGPPGARQLQFMIAEEGITAAAYIVISMVDRVWTIEECGDRDVSGARVGALLQALIAAEPAERRPIVRGWLPYGFVPPQVSIASAAPAAEALWGRYLAAADRPLRLSGDELVYWRSDLF